MFLVLGHNYSYTDLDSLVSAAVFAEIWTALEQPAKAALLNPKGLKESTLKIMKIIGDIEIPETVTKEELENSDLILVDHNDPEESYGKLGVKQAPYMIIDHHQDIGLPAKHKIIEPVGSTCTLIAEMSKTKGVRLTDRQARALAFGIASDTRGLKGRKTSERDIEAVDYLYREYAIPESVEVIAEMVLQPIDVQKMSVKAILGNSLKEYLNGSIGIAAIEVADESYRQRLGEIMDKARQTSFDLYIFVILKNHVSQTEIFYFDRTFGLFPERECRSGLLSRAKDLVPEIMAKIKNAGSDQGAKDSKE